jgi:hypothetical protein
MKVYGIAKRRTQRLLRTAPKACYDVQGRAIRQSPKVGRRAARTRGTGPRSKQGYGAHRYGREETVALSIHAQMYKELAAYVALKRKTVEMKAEGGFLSLT